VIVRESAVTYLMASWGALSASQYAWQYLFQAGRVDPVTGLYIFEHRDYSTSLGRWMRTDPLRYKAGNIDLYGFVSNSPMRATDSSGMDAMGALGGAGAGSIVGGLYSTGGAIVGIGVIWGLATAYGVGWLGLGLGFAFVAATPAVGVVFTAIAVAAVIGVVMGTTWGAVEGSNAVGFWAGAGLVRNDRNLRLWAFRVGFVIGGVATFTGYVISGT
jgi:RHS repeat-associated protein